MSTANTVENDDNDDASQVLESDNIEILDEVSKDLKKLFFFLNKCQLLNYYLCTIPTYF